jgi:hypothetical protein
MSTTPFLRQVLDAFRGFRNAAPIFRRAILHRRVLRHLVPESIGRHYFDRGSCYLAYHPDAYLAFGKHGAFRLLLKEFLAENLAINGGDITRLWSFILNIDEVLCEGVPGHFAELGVWKGNTASILAHYAKESGRTLFLFDTFEGFSSADIVHEDARTESMFHDTSLEKVQKLLGPGPHYRVVKGWFPESLTEEHRALRYAIVSLDCDLYEPMKAGLEFFYPRMPLGALGLLHDYSSGYWAGARRAVEEFCQSTGERPVLMPDKSGSAFFRKSKISGPEGASETLQPCTPQ